MRPLKEVKKCPSSKLKRGAYPSLHFALTYVGKLSFLKLSHNFCMSCLPHIKANVIMLPYTWKLCSEASLASRPERYEVTPILEVLRPPQNLQNRRVCVLYAKTPKSEVLRPPQKLQNRRFCVVLKILLIILNRGTPFCRSVKCRRLHLIYLCEYTVKTVFRD